MDASYVARLAVGFLPILTQLAPPPERLPLQVRIESGDVVSVTDTFLARREAERIFETAAVRVLWVRDQKEARRSGELTIRVLTDAQADHLVPPSQRALVRLALAVPDARIAYVHYPRVVGVARRWHVDPGTLLGRVVAHELVHILLRQHDHATSGLMAAEMDPRGIEPPRLTRSEQENLRKAVMEVADARGGGPR